MIKLANRFKAVNKAVNKLNKIIVQLGRELFDGRMVARSRISIQEIRIIILQMPNKFHA